LRIAKYNGENLAPKSNPGEKEETSADTVFFMKKICSGSNKFIVSNQQVLKTPAREGDKLVLTSEKVGRGFYYKKILGRVKNENVRKMCSKIPDKCCIVLIYDKFRATLECDFILDFD